MGRIRDIKLKTHAKEIVKQFPDKVSLDFNANKKFLNEYFNITGKRNRNKIAGYIIRWLKTKDNTYEEIRRLNAYKKEKRKRKKKDYKIGEPYLDE